ncbi:hypothetical protein J6590_082267 [Homalodisca vitripennis]|nr:hypothetical protein J6590_082267 [Homalodisca vitripennis]
MGKPPSTNFQPHFVEVKLVTLSSAAANDLGTTAHPFCQIPWLPLEQYIVYKTASLHPTHGIHGVGGHPHPTTSVTNVIGGSTRPSDVPRAQHAPAGMPVAQHALPTRYRLLNTPVRCAAGSARPCGGEGGSIRPSDEVPGAQYARPVSRGLNTSMRGVGGSTRPSD